MSVDVIVLTATAERVREITVPIPPWPYYLEWVVRPGTERLGMEGVVFELHQRNLSEEAV